VKRVEALLRRLSRRAERSVSLEEALFTDRGFAYAWYRARFLFLRIPFGLFLHAAEIVAFSAAYDLDLIGPMLAIRSLPAVGAALWWGALEALRSQVRQARANDEWGRAERAVRSFLALSVDVGILGAVLAAAYVEFFPSELDGFNIFDAYAIACSLRFCLELVARTYHAGIFALRRVYRPVWSLLLPDVLELALALALWAPLGPWGFSFSTLFGGIIGVAFQLHYSRRAYREEGHFMPTFRRIGRARRDLERRDYGQLLRHALANLSAHVDAFLILILSRSLHAGLPFVVLLHAGRPLFATVSNLARLFYFDFQRLELGQSAFLRRRFSRIVTRFAAVVASGAIVLAATLHWLLFKGEHLLDFGLLALYIAVRSVMAVEQLRLFTAGRYRVLALGTAALVVTAVATRLVISRERVEVAVIIGALGLLALWCHYENRKQRGELQQGGIVGLLQWLSRLRRETGSVELGYALVDRHAGGALTVVLRALETSLGAHAVLSRVGRRAVVWYAPSIALDPTLRRRITSAAAGCLETVRVSGPHTAEQSLALALALEPLAKLAAPASSGRITAIQLRTTFRETFGTERGRILDLKSAPSLRELPQRSQRSFVARSIAVACVGKPAPARQPDFPRVAVYCPGGDAELVFMAPSSVDSEVFRQFAATVEQSSLSETLATTRSAPRYA
jgi:hypothetical protein